MAMTAFDLILDITARKPSKGEAKGNEMATWNLSVKQVSWLKSLCSEASRWGEQFDGSRIEFRGAGEHCYDVHLADREDGEKSWYVFAWWPNGAGHVTRQRHTPRRYVDASDLGLTGWPERVEFEGRRYDSPSPERDGEGEVVAMTYVSVTGDGQLVVVND